ncbi:DUF368 domain-containing protein [Heliorestis acidaminivorans]|uniref:DUF368 domain-containing protein n=1 Tax=Heliorestis acidaminivorans TaxID=553427 RepID=A0A6I0EZU1_9FIRM|nr:DUF368 domain-containing protein [Heliorestis acidaminivorans]
MLEWRNIPRGFVMGISDLIPGVSGGTIALVLGIYQSLINAINGIFTKEWKKHLLFLIPLGLGIGLALLTVSHLMKWLMTAYPKPTFYFFLGLIIGIIPTLLKEVRYKETFRSHHYLLLGLAALAVAGTTLIREDNLGAIITDLSFFDYILLFFSGWLASSAMILPGVSGSFIFLLLGVYPTVIHALSVLHIPIIITVIMGIGIGLILTSKIIHYLFIHYKIATYAVMIGFVVGSIFVVFPGLSSDIFIIFLSFSAFLGGLVSAYLLATIENRKIAQKETL